LGDQDPKVKMAAFEGLEEIAYRDYSVRVIGILNNLRVYFEAGSKSRNAELVRCSSRLLLRLEQGKAE